MYASHTLKVLPKCLKPIKPPSCHLPLNHTSVILGAESWSKWKQMAILTAWMTIPIFQTIILFKWQLSILLLPLL